MTFLIVTGLIIVGLYVVYRLKDKGGTSHESEPGVAGAAPAKRSPNN